MRFLAIALFLVAGVSYCHAGIGMALTIEELTMLTTQYKAPFTSTALARIHNSGLWGAKRAKRTTDVVIINTSRTNFTGISSRCFGGAFSPGLLPENYLNEHTSMVYGIENSSGHDDYYTCTLYYDSPGSSVSFIMENRMHEETHIMTTAPYGLRSNIFNTYRDDNNQVTIIISNIMLNRVAMPSPQGAPSPQPKGSPNKGASMQDLIAMAKNAGAPFSKPAMRRLQDSTLWEAHRAARSTDAVIINSSGKHLQLRGNYCVQGGLSNGLLLENSIPRHASTVFGIESTQKQTGVQCSIKYEGQDGDSWIIMNIHNPFHGDNFVYTSSSWNLKISPVLGHGNNNQVRFMVSDSYFDALPSQNGGPPRTPKGSRNKAVKASKSGSRVRIL